MLSTLREVIDAYKMPPIILGGTSMNSGLRVAGCGPLLKTPQVIIEQQQQPQEKLLLVEEGKAKNITEGQNITSSTPEKQQEVLPSKNQSCIERHHLLRNRISPAFSCGTNSYNRAGVSFSFSKKVHLKLESSASVFSENMEEAYDCIGSPRHKTKQAHKECHSCIHMGDERRANLQKRLSALQGHPDSIASCSLPGKKKMQKGTNQNTNREQLEVHLSSHKDNLHLPDLECAGSPNEKEQEEELQNEIQKSLETVVAPHHLTTNVCRQQTTYKHSDVLFAEHVSEFSGQQLSKQGHPCEINCNPCAFKQSPHYSKPVNENTETSGGDSLVHDIKPKELPFLHVLSKDGSTALRWPTELLLFTKTEPSISYGCNPLYFDFRLSLSHRDSGHNEVNAEGPREPFKKMDVDGIEASGLTEIQQPSSEPDNQSLKPKKKKRVLSLNTSQLELDSDTENEMNQCAPKYISDDLNENIPEVPAHLDCSQRHYARATSPHTTMHVRSLAQHLQNFEKTLHEEVTRNICIYPLMTSRTKKQTCTKCDLICSHRQSNLNLVPCPGDISDSRKDSILGYTLGSTGECLEREDNGSFASCWKFSSLQKPFSDRQSNYSDTSASSVTSYASCYSSHRSSDHSRSHLPFCCKRKQKPVERQKCKHKKHNCISSSDDADEDCFFNKKSQRSRNCTQRHTVKYQRHSRYRHLLQRDISKQTRNTYPLCKHSRNRSYSSSIGSSIQDSGSSERSSSCTRSRGSSSGSLAKESMHSWGKYKRDVKSNVGTEPGKSNSAHSDCQYLRCPSKHVGICSISHSERGTLGHQKSLTAKLLLEKVNSKRNQEQTQNTENFSNTCELGLPHSQPGITSTSLMAGEVMFLSSEKALNTDTSNVWNNKTIAVESGEGKNQISAIDSVTLTANAAYGSCLLKDLIQRGTGYQTPNMEKDAAIKEQSNILPGEMQSLLQRCDAVPNDFSGAFPSHTYSVVANLTETKEEHNANMDLNGEGSNLNCYSDNAMHKSSETENSKCISFPLTQQPITFSPDEIDKYKFLQLQAQQHMQKQLLAKHLKVLPATGPAAFSTSPAVQHIPVQQHSSVSTLHHTLLQSFALSAGVHPHRSHLSLTHIHPFSQSQFAPISLSPFAPTFMPAHSTLLAGHPFHLVSAAPLHPSHLMIPPLPHAAFIPTLFAPQLNAAASSAIPLSPLIHPLFQGQELHRRS